ncbi:unnamed protein product [Ilex paraguariensis]|uniref:Uncharacterized protein n=1 Tax=Ilex paraguariensis TaxID=185542 RepID=A0ABC8V260_9AQUA
MEGSSESGWQKSDCSWGINSSAVSDRNPRLVRASYIRLFVETPPHSGCIPGRKVVRAVDCSDVSLRQWLDNAERSVDALECLHIFTQIVEIVTWHIHKELLFRMCVPHALSCLHSTMSRLLSLHLARILVRILVRMDQTAKLPSLRVPHRLCPMT